MPEKTSETEPEPAPLAVNVRVSVRRQAEPAATGEVVEDFAELTDTAEGGHDRAPVDRWAIALDDGRLVFADTDDLTVEPGTPRPAPEADPPG